MPTEKLAPNLLYTKVLAPTTAVQPGRQSWASVVQWIACVGPVKGLYLSPCYRLYRLSPCYRLYRLPIDFVLFDLLWIISAPLVASVLLAHPLFLLSRTATLPLHFVGIISILLHGC